MQRREEDAFVWPRVKLLAPGALRRWFAAGWADLAAAPGPSLFYGATLALMGFLLTQHFGGAVGIALTTGFLLVGPFVAIGLYELSRRRERHEPARLAPSLVAWRANLPAIGFYALVLTLMLAAWIRVSVVVVALFFPGGRIDWAAPDTWAFAAAYAAAGGALALFVFATSSLSLPLLLDRRDMDTITAAIVSFNALRANFATMLVWAACIVALTAAGFATYYVGLVVALPLIGHMTWHAYRESVAPHG
ncbi:MAG: DUF2189 domain-containing protein [Betaproteobacteria bacterium]|nr:DUF2189 domain-containing protein [Betaproteobacteria bacterium]MDH5221534.1 DUF2189 domain-containing protein [Betaproteobacteria bacterium]MDH5349455.1 DUF2189 domain-containing protein [Betaproteobacteria bacterium]